MTNEDILKVIKFHKLCTKLKNLERTGWKIWNVEGTRVESVAEHIFGCSMLAVAIMSVNKNHGLDENKVLSMLALHECEEIFIGDMVHYQGEVYKNKSEISKPLLTELFNEFGSPNNFKNLLDEFMDGETAEAKFCLMVDKLEADLQAYLYEDNINYEKVSKDIFEKETIKKAIKDGGTCLGDYFSNNDSGIFNDEFKQIIAVAKEFYKK